MSLYIATPCYYSDDSKAQRLIDSCRRNGMECHPFGIGEQWRGTVGGETYAGFCALPRIIEKLPEQYTHVLYTDCEDVFAVAGEDEIMAKYQRLAGGSGVLLSAETQMYPPAELEYYDANSGYSEKYGLWRYQNGGGFMGTSEAMIETLDWLWTHYTESMEGMYRWAHMICDSDAPIVRLDTGCSIFQTMSGQGFSSMELERRPFNTVTKSHPVFLHWNGRLGGIDDAWKKVYG